MSYNGLQCVISPCLGKHFDHQVLSDFPRPTDAFCVQKYVLIGTADSRKLHIPGILRTVVLRHCSLEKENTVGGTLTHGRRRIFLS